ncbi:MAG: PSD1 and planctomycete cytochrome C domain-containing protein [Luteolibacter sp.]
MLLSALLASCGEKKAPTPAGDVEKGAPSTAVVEKVTFNEHIRPIFSDTCFACHGFDAKHRKADLRLDTFEGATAKLKDSEEHAIVPGRPELSAVWQRLVTTDSNEAMPPVDFHKTITGRQKDLIRKWIEQGAVYEAHWAYQEIKRPEVPVLAKHGKDAVNPIDAFILAKLEKTGLEPAPLADRATLVRRLALDLTGLPPSDEELKRFAAAPWGEVVKHYLAAPGYGERMAVPWLDAVRFADSVGFHGDQNQRIFPYRDYVIDSFRKNKRFDTFVTEQLAGDLLPNPSDEQLIATGFLRLNQITREGGAQPKEYLAKYAADRVRAVSGAFLGQTVGCAECHDHKFDPISAEDFYSLGAFFSDVQQWGVYVDYAYTPEPELKGMDNNSPYPPELVARSTSQQEIIRWLQKDMMTALGNRPVPQAELDVWRGSMVTFLAAHPDGWLPLTPVQAGSAAGTKVAVVAEQAVLATGAPVAKEVITVRLPLPAGVNFAQARLEVLPDPANDGKVGRGKDGHFAVTPAFAWSQAGAAAQPLKLRYSQADLDAPQGFFNGYRKSHALEPVWRSAPGKLERPLTLASHPHTSVFCFDEPRVAAAGSELIVTLASEDIGRFRVSISPFLEAVPGMAAAPQGLAEALKQASPGAQDLSLIRAAYHLSSKALIGDAQVYGPLIARVRECDAGWARSMIAVQVPEAKRLVTRILPRGNWQNESGKVVQPAVLHFLPSTSLPKNIRLTRLDLAKWITAPENPLTARHFMNRLWKQFFGNGISNVLNDLGGQGEWPSHPELLDWLSAEFRESGWDVNHMVTLITTSLTYQQEAAKRDDLAVVDPLNRLLAQQGARRLDAEFVRDNALAVSGLLDTSYTGGPSVYPYQPEGYYEPMNFPVRSYKDSTDSRQYRRGVYMHWQRSYLHPMLQNFDAPSREECAADRLQANTPLQALTQLNDPTFIEAARAFAARVMAERPKAEPAARISRVFQLALAREPKPEELQSLKAFLATRAEDFRSGRDDAKKFLNVGLYRTPADIDTTELAAWTQVCRVVLNLHETITRY